MINMPKRKQAGRERARKEPYLSCPYCGGTEFDVCGYLYHRQPYDSKKDEYDISKVHWNESFPESVECRNPKCERDVTAYFVKRGIIDTFYAVRPARTRTR